MAHESKLPKRPFNLIVRGGKMSSIAGDRPPIVVIKASAQLHSELRSATSTIGKSRYAS